MCWLVWLGMLPCRLFCISFWTNSRLFRWVALLTDAELSLLLL